MYLLPEQPTATMATVTRIRVRTLESTAESYAIFPRGGPVHGIRLTFMRTLRFSVFYPSKVCNKTKKFGCRYVLFKRNI